MSEGGWNGFALGKTAAQAADEAQKNTLRQDLNAARDKVKFMEDKIKSLETALDRSNAVNYDQAARIVDLEAKLGVLTPGVQATQADTIRRLQEREEHQRMNLERAEARVCQLMSLAQKHELDLPPEDLFFSRGHAGTGPATAPSEY